MSIFDCCQLSGPPPPEQRSRRKLRSRKPNHDSELDVVALGKDALNRLLLFDAQSPDNGRVLEQRLQLFR